MHADTPVKKSYSQTLVRVLLVVLLAAVIVAGRLVSVEKPLAWLTQEVRSLGIWGPLAFGGLFIALTIFFLPATPVVVAAGAVFGPVEGTLIISLASTLSAVFSFLVGRYIARDWAAGKVRGY